MNNKAIYEIGDIIRVRYGWAWKPPWFTRVLSPKEIMDSYEYTWFKMRHPELCRLAEGQKASEEVVVKYGRRWFKTRREAEDNRGLHGRIYYDRGQKAYFILKPKRAVWKL